MEKYLALIKNKLVEAVIVGDENFISHVKNRYDYIIDVTDLKRPTAGDSYYPDTGTFVSNILETNIIPVNETLEHLQSGTEDGFESFETSKYTVSYKDGMVTIGCKTYSGIGLRDTLHNLLVKKIPTTTIFTSLATGPTHGKFDITWDDAKKIHEALLKVRFK